MKITEYIAVTGENDLGGFLTQKINGKSIQIICREHIGNIDNLSKLAALHGLARPYRLRKVMKRIAHDDFALVCLRYLDQCARLGGAEHHWLFQHNM